jgi:hypothetical protein
MDQLFIQCACFGEIVHVSRDEDSGEIYVSCYEPRGTKYTWGYRLKHIWHILTKGHPYHDDVILSVEDSKQLGVWLLEQSEKQYVDPDQLGGSGMF